MPSRLGVPNKQKQEVRALIDKYAKMEDVIIGLVKSAKRGNVVAAKTLLEYRYGKPREMNEPNGDSSELLGLAKALGKALVSLPASGAATHPDTEVQE